jgi:hypothetical protein
VSRPWARISRASAFGSISLGSRASARSISVAKVLGLEPEIRNGARHVEIARAEAPAGVASREAEAKARVLDLVEGRRLGLAHEIRRTWVRNTALAQSHPALPASQPQSFELRVLDLRRNCSTRSDRRFVDVVCHSARAVQVDCFRRAQCSNSGLKTNTRPESTSSVPLTAFRTLAPRSPSATRCSVSAYTTTIPASGIT